jgi:EmrB/QacA subfamily drug resistance transporter
MFGAVNVALPSLAKTFETDFNVVQWVVLSFLLASGTLLPIVGRWADMVGKKKLFLLGYAVFIVGSLLCGLSPNVGFLIIFRIIQGLGSAFVTALGLAIITDAFPHHERGRALGFNAAVITSGIVIGPSLGGLLIDVLTWRWVFFVVVPLGALGLIIAQRFISPDPPLGRQSFDIVGAVSLFGALLLLSLGLTLGQDLGFASTLIFALLVTGGFLLTAFLVIELRVKDPLIDLRLFRKPGLGINLGVAFLTFMAISAAILMMPFYLENVLGYAPRSVGILMSVGPIFIVIVTPLAGLASDKFGERPISLIGLTILLFGYFSVGTLSESTTAIGFLLRFLPIGLGMGIYQTPNSSAVMGSLPLHQSGLAGSFLAMTRTLGSSTGIAVLGTIWVARVNARANGGQAADVTEASASLQVAGLHDVLLVIQVIIGLALIVSILASISHWRGRGGLQR